MGINGGIWDAPQERDKTATPPLKLGDSADTRSKEGSPSPIIPPEFISPDNDEETETLKGVTVRGVNDQEQETDTDTPPDKPMVTLPDGSKVDAEVYFSEKFKAKETELDTEKTRLDGVLNFLYNNPTLEQAMTGNAQQTANQINSDNPDANTDLFEPIKLEDDADETEIAIANSVNEMGEKFNGAYNGLLDKFNAFSKKYDELEEFVGDNHLEVQLAKTSALYGIPREEIIAKSRELKIGNPDALAKVILGEKAHNSALETAQEKAKAERESDAGKIGSPTSRQGADGREETSKPGRGIKDPTKQKKEVARRYKFLSAVA